MKRNSKAVVLATAFDSVKKRRLNDNDNNNNDDSSRFESSCSDSFVNIRRRDSRVIRRRRSLNSVTKPVSGHRSDVEEVDHALESCCSSNGSSQGIEFVDLEDESVEIEETSTDHTCRERREETPPSLSAIQSESSTELESTATRPPKMMFSRRRSTQKITPTECELEEFFAEAEKSIQQKFANKYNYDIVKDGPLQGRYEWIPLNP